ncbi:MAG TPA: APC family permease [Ktedonobacteraceae bacterium]|nr:APC family permease [Ktedonobacteraceae bacterium]
MAAQTSSNTSTGMKPTLGLTGVTINAMALIAPGAFLWTTYQLQAAPGSAMNMWFAVFVATAIALFTATAYASLAKRYPEAGTGSSYYFAEVSVLQREEHQHFKFARLSKFIVGWASHLYYWVYPGVMVAFMGTLIIYIGQTFNPDFASAGWEKVLICIIFAGIVGGISYIGVTGSTMANIIINVIQILALVVFSVLAIVFRLQNPSLPYAHSSALSVVTPHDFSGLIFQSTIAILLVVGFESATALAAEAKNPARDIPRGVLLSLVIQAVIFYFFEYFAANFFIGGFYTNSAGKGFAAAYGSSAPIGDMATIIGNKLLGGNGTAFAIIMAATVVIALVGTALSCQNTGVRVTYAMGKDTELPLVFGFLHGKYRTPHVAVIVLTVISAAIGSYGVLSIDNLTQVTLISNIGTFLLYGMTCIICVVAFLGFKGRGIYSTIIAPVLGVVLNVAMLIGVLYFAIVGGGSTQTDTIIAGIFSVAWLVIGLAFLYGRQLFTGVPVLHPEDYKEKVIVNEQTPVPTMITEQ